MRCLDSNYHNWSCDNNWRIRMLALSVTCFKWFWKATMFWRMFWTMNSTCLITELLHQLLQECAVSIKHLISLERCCRLGDWHRFSNKHWFRANSQAWLPHDKSHTLERNYHDLCTCSNPIGFKVPSAPSSKSSRRAFSLKNMIYRTAVLFIISIWSRTSAIYHI